MYQIWIPILSLLVGAGIGSLLTFSIPLVYAKYLSIAILAALDCILGGTRAIINNTFDSVIMLTGFFMNSILAAALAFLGDKIGIDMFLATTVCFSLRIFSNLAFIRRDLITVIREKRAANSNVKKAKIQKMPTALPVAKVTKSEEKVKSDEKVVKFEEKAVRLDEIENEIEEDVVPLKVKAVHSSELGPEATISTTIQIVDEAELKELEKELNAKLDAKTDDEDVEEENLLKQYTEDEITGK